MNHKGEDREDAAVDKSTFAATLVDSPRQAPKLTRRHWLGTALAGSAVAGLEAASLAGSWDHRSVRIAPARPAASAAPSSARLLHVGHSCHLIEVSGQAKTGRIPPGVKRAPHLVLKGLPLPQLE